ncbi:MAG: class I SAM-dependent methyltransferase [Desulfobacterales bacterium]
MTDAENNTCRLCGGKGQQTILHDISTRDNDRFALSQCDNCALVTTYPMASENILQRYYDQDYWQSGQLKKSTSLDTLYRLRMAPVISAIRKYTTDDSKILDWGCGDGSFIRLLHNFGLHCSGIDAYKKDLNDPQISSTTIEKAEFPDGSFDIITCFHVLEHLADPLTSVKHALMLLKIGGLIIIEVPNLDSVGFQVFKRRWQPLEIPTHLNHFTPATLRKVFETAGKIQIVKTEFFSHRISPSALVLSAFPALAPRRTRKKYKGRYPLLLLGLYLSLQLLAYPLAFAGSLIQRGEIVRMYIRKSG